MENVVRVLLSIVCLVLLASFARAEDWPPAEYYVKSGIECDRAKDAADCDFVKVTWPKDYALAIAGDYQGQRNVSYCLSTGCYGVIVKNPMLGCAWRMVIIGMGDLKLDPSDTSNLKYFCGPELIDDGQFQAAKAQAAHMLRNLIH